MLRVTCGLAGSVALSQAGPAAEKRDDSTRDAVKRGLAWLIEQQAKDGGWHSTSYGALQGGSAITALVLYTVAQLREELTRGKKGDWQRAFEFFEPGLAKRGTLACPDGSLDYPTYAVPMWLVACERLKIPRPAEAKAKLVQYLIDAQLCEQRGFDRSHAAYGGWDFLGAGDAQGITTGSNISVFTNAVEALSRSEHHDAEKAIARAKDWLVRCQDATANGGFAFTTEPASLNNKAEFQDAKQNRPRAYGSATADGVRALVYCGFERNDRRILRGIDWLAQHPGMELVPGFDDLPLELGWQRGLRFYYLASLARALPLFPAAEAAKRQAELAKVLVGEQKADGSWRSDAPRMREDDPLIATCFALTALANC